MLSPRKLEKITKGFSNHRRIQMLILLDTSPGLSLGDISDVLKINVKTASEHLRRLTLPGLVEKENQGATVCHSLTPIGKSVLRFLKRIE